MPGSVVRPFARGSLDYCLTTLVPLLLAEIVGDLADDKQVTELAPSLTGEVS
jgi:hypothetical protein